MQHPIQACFPKQATFFDPKHNAYFTKCVICGGAPVRFDVPACLEHAELHESAGHLRGKL